ncbi:MAG TPA: hypothetical protein VF996_02845 [Candidatus Saccharimonadales bacterium]
MEAGERSVEKQADFGLFKVRLLQIAGALSQYHAAPYEHGVTAENTSQLYLLLYKAFGSSEWKWTAPEGQAVAIPEAIGRHYQLYQPEYETGAWIYPFEKSRAAPGPLTKVDTIEADVDGIYAVKGGMRVVLFGPEDPFHFSGTALESIDLINDTDA